MQDNSTTSNPLPTTAIFRAYKTELDPNNKQRTSFIKHCGAARFVFNWALADRIKRYEENGESTNLYEQKRRFNSLKHEQFPWLSEVAYKTVDSSFDHLDRAYQNFFRRIKKGDKKPGFPKFKSRKKGLGNFTLRGCIHVEAGRIKLPRIGWIRLKEHGYLPGNGVKILSAAISEKAGRWFVSLQVEQDVKQLQPATGPIIGVDLGVKTLATCSDGTVFENPKTLYKYEARLRQLNKELHRRQNGSVNRNKTRQKLAKLHAKISNVRNHALHQISHYLTAKAKLSTIVIEDLNVKGMVQNRHLSKAISDASFCELRRQIEYKAKWHGVEVIVADRWFASSKTCSSCGEVKHSLLLSERTFVCESCGVVIERDLNAAVNLAQMAGKRSVTALGEASAGIPWDVKLASLKGEHSTAGSVSL